MPALVFRLTALFIPPLILPHYKYFNLRFEASAADRHISWSVQAARGWWKEQEHFGHHSSIQEDFPGTQLLPKDAERAQGPRVT